MDVQGHHCTFSANINDQGVVGVFGEKESKKNVETLKQINKNADVA